MRKKPLTRQQRSEVAKRRYEKFREEKKGFPFLSKEQSRVFGKIGGKIGGKRTAELGKLPLQTMTKEQRRVYGKIGAAVARNSPKSSINKLSTCPVCGFTCKGIGMYSHMKKHKQIG
jgi:hypothetical protein